MTRWVPTPEAGVLQATGCARYARSDAVGWWMSGCMVGPICAVMGVVLALVPQDPPYDPDPLGWWWGAPLLLVGLALFVVCGLPMIVAKLRSTKVGVLPGYTWNEHGDPYRQASYDPDSVMHAYFSLREEVLRLQALPLWRAYRVAVQAYAIGKADDQRDAALARGRLILELREHQRQIDAARALVRAGVGVVEADDLERAQLFLRELDKLPPA